jgi:uncharacterized coiled-coil protein SlyX
MKNRSTIFIIVLSVLACFALLPKAQADDEDLGGGNSGAGANALFSVSTGGFNSAFGWFSQFSLTDAFFNTGMGAGSLDLNDGSNNTAVGAAAMLLNTTGSENTAVGTDALVFNSIATDNNAVGEFALFNNDSSGGGLANFNNAFGNSALTSNVDGGGNVAIGQDALFNSNSSFNTAVGLDAGENVIAGSENIYLGDTAGTLDFTGAAVGDESGVIRIGSFFSGNTACFINGITQNFVPPFIGQTIVAIDPITGQLFSTTDAAAGKVAEQQKTIEELQATVSQLKGEMQTMVAQLKEQATQIQKVSAQLEMSKPAPQVVLNKP